MSKIYAITLQIDSGKIHYEFDEPVETEEEAFHIASTAIAHEFENNSSVDQVFTV